MEKLYSQGNKVLSTEEQALLQGKPFVKVIFSIRSDRFHLLNRLDNYLPTVLKYPYELSALTLDSAREAVVGPASLPQHMSSDNGHEFLSGPFFYSEVKPWNTSSTSSPTIKQADKTQALDPSATPEKSQHIEGTQLQIICSSIEQRVGIRKIIFQVEVDDLGNLQEIIANYYNEKIESLEAHEYLPVRRRSSRKASSLRKAKATASGSAFLKARSCRPTASRPRRYASWSTATCLRAEPRMTGGYTYELSHDTLIKPVLKAKARRLKKEATRSGRARTPAPGRRDGTTEAKKPKQRSGAPKKPKPCIAKQKSPGQRPYRRKNGQTQPGAKPIRSAGEPTFSPSSPSCPWLYNYLGGPGC